VHADETAPPTTRSILHDVGEKPVRTIEELEKLPLAERHRVVDESIVTDLSTLPPEFLARIRRRGRELLAARGIALPPQE
jgi:hypothetical protein